MQSKNHWEHVYASKGANTVSWYQEHAERSLKLIRATGVARSEPVIDVGGGASTLIDDLLADGYSDLTVIDLSAAALAAARTRLGAQAAAVHWLEADITTVKMPRRHYAVWHDRAVFHFLTTAEERAAYLGAVFHAVRPGGYVIVATFAEDGPAQCSGLPVQRYSADSLHAEFGEAFTLLEHETETHRTPSGTLQQFVYCFCRKVGC